MGEEEELALAKKLPFAKKFKPFSIDKALQF